MIRKEFIERSLVGIEEKSIEQESIMSEKRFDEFDTSPLTVEPITSARYIQMTKVQEATIAACLKFAACLKANNCNTTGSRAWKFAKNCN
ncbi:probable DEAD-box ATP-dependent RNA helicase 48 [Daucus carota subsp. sativus]|uniref:probable DEAD-box ATP-dependent RNA helicase 48 n=1 Tax=Daucus carota subsp. sativus TaxID=79200 RepID=UPI0030828A67